MNVGPYQIEEEIGRGGMGAVYRARGPDGRAVAVKVLLRATREAHLRFQREQRLLSQFGERDGFVSLIDAGTTPSGPYLVMPLITGGSLKDKLEDGAKLPVDEALDLGRALASALAVAHERGVVHRDLKPDNVLFAADGRPLVSDLGLAKHFDRSAGVAEGSVSMSKSGDIVGSIGYMAPEQMNDSKVVGPPADVFALGAIIYEALAGEAAFPGDNPHARVAKLVAGKIVPLRKHRPEVPRWFAEAVERALLPDPAQRFENAGAFARALEGPPVAAGSRAWLAVPAILIAGIAGAAAVIARRSPETPPKPPIDDRTKPAIVASATKVEPEKPAVALPPQCWSFQSTARARLVSVMGTYNRRSWNGFSAIAASPDGKLAFTGSPDGTAKTWSLAHGEEVASFPTPKGIVITATFSRDGSRVFAGDSAGNVHLFDLESHAVVFSGRAAVDEKAQVLAIAALPGARYASGASDGTVRVWTAQGMIAWMANARGRVQALAAAPDGKDLIGCSPDFAGLRAWEIATGEDVTGPQSDNAPIISLAFSKDGTHLLAGMQGEARLMEIATGTVAQRFPGEGWVLGCGVTSDGQRALTFSTANRKKLTVWDTATGEETITCEGHARDVGFASVVPGAGRRAISESVDGLLRLWDLDTGREVWPLGGHRGWVYSVAVSRDGRQVFSGGIDRRLRVWDLASGNLAKTLPPHGDDDEHFVHAVAVSPDGRRALTAGRDNGWTLWDVEHGKLEKRTVLPRAPGRRNPDRINEVQFAPDGKRFVTASSDGSLELWDATTGEVATSLEGHGEDADVAGANFSPDGKLLASAAPRATVRVWDLATGQVVQDLKDHDAAVGLVRFVGKDKLAVSYGDGVVCLWDIQSRTSRTLGKHGDLVCGLCATPDGKLVISSSWPTDKSIRIWDVASGKQVDLIDLSPTTDFAASLASTPDGKGFVAGTGRGVVLRFELTGLDQRLPR